MIDPYRFAVAGGTGPLDAHSVNLWSACSIAKLLGAYTGGVYISLRDSTSGTSTAIGDNGAGGLDTAAISAYLGSHNGTAPGFGSQVGSGGLRDFGNVVGTTAQPAAATAGTFLGSLQFDGTNDNYTSVDNSNTGISAYTVYLRGKVRTTVTQIIFELSSNYNATNAVVVYYDAGALSVGLHTGTAYSRSDFTGLLPNDNVFAFRFDLGAGSAPAMTACFVNGVLQTRTGNGDVGTPSGTFAVTRWYLGARNGGASLPAALNVREFLIYETAHSDADVASVSAILAALP